MKEVGTNPYDCLPQSTYVLDAQAALADLHCTEQGIDHIVRSMVRTPERVLAISVDDPIPARIQTAGHLRQILDYYES